MTSVIHIERTPAGLCVLTPLPQQSGPAPSVLDHAPQVDVALLEVTGGHLSWSVLATHPEPVAVLDRAEDAQEWVWALYGEQAAVALAAVSDAHPGPPTQVPARPGLPELAADARMLAYAHWASHWWPSSALDGIPPLDAQVLRQDLARLTERCDLLLEAAAQHGPAEPWESHDIDHIADMTGIAGTNAAPSHETPVGGRGPQGICDSEPGDSVATRSRPAHAADYALAAGAVPQSPAPDGLVIAQGVVGTDWRRYPPGLVDASEQALSWQATRAAGRTVIAVCVAAAPELTAPGAARHVPAHLVPWAVIGGQPASTATTTALGLAGDAWVAQLTAPEDQAATALTVGVYLPGFDPLAWPGPDEVSADPGSSGGWPAAQHPQRAAGHAVRERIRELVRDRLARAAAGTYDGLLTAERAAAETEAETDY
ncbi:hypothetical protein [Streptomyces zagrosensis]|uniref:Uncharacterized protein n=1 Tax=Streptomyces zagrosensis TaxID=1042984 RepID=A0A7W9QCV6_9ACTN|nr:hypothetical protein [Streptomyces zagrosensis]MBB5937946.1 hypothetical protein [Streptomyces zagrosensis]